MDVNKIKSMPVGIVGLGLMGSSIAVALLGSGHRVIAVAPITGEKEKASKYMRDLLHHAAEGGILANDIASSMKALEIVEDYSRLAVCGVVLECVIEDRTIKEQVYRNITDVVDDHTIIASN